MRKKFVLGLALCALLLSAGSVTRAQMTEEQKRRLFLKAREDIHPAPRPEASATPRPKPKTVSTPRPTPTPTPKPTPDEEDKPEPTPHPSKPESKPEKDGEPDKTPAPKSTPAPSPESTPRPAAPDKAAPSNVPAAPIEISKSGLLEEKGLEPPPKNTGGWFRRWRYLTPAVRRAIDQAMVSKGRWQYIIVHNSGTRQGNARIFDTYHRRVRKMPNGLAYHFVIGNGSSSGNGEIEIGPRWTKQLPGGHVASDWLNKIGIGICLVGDFNRDTPTEAQKAALDELIQYLRARVGKSKGKPAQVFPHKVVNPANRSTDCPGDHFDYRWLKQKFPPS